MKDLGSGVIRLVAVILFALCALPGRAQDYPSKPIRLIVPYSAGSVTDTLARMLAIALTERTQQPTVIENRTGAGGILALQALHGAAPDGYTVGMISTASTLQPWLLKSMRYNVATDFMPLTLMYAGNYLLTVRADFPAATFAEFVAYAKANPGKILFGSSGTGTTGHLSVEWLKQAMSVDLVHVPFKGAPEVYSAMFSGAADAAFDLVGTARPMLDSKRVRAIAVTSTKRMPQFAELPTMTEFVPGLEFQGWVGLALPLGTPRPIAQRLEADLRAALNSPAIVKRMVDMGVEPGGNSSEELHKFLVSERRKWETVVKAAGIQPE